MIAQPMTVLRVAKLKSWGSIGSAGAHNMRQRETPNAAPDRTPSNQYLIGQPHDHLPTLVREKIGEQTIRKNAVLAFEVVMSASPQYFRANNPEQGGHWNDQRLEQWTTASIDWLYMKWKDRVISAVLHLDEQTPHIQAVVVPLDEKGKLNCRALIGGSRQTLRDLQTSYAGSVQHLGIQRGIEGSKAQHQDIQTYYHRANSAFQPLPEVTTPPAPAPRPAPQRPRFLASSAAKAAYRSDIDRWEREKQALEEQERKRNAELRVQFEAAVAAARRHQAQAAQAEALAQEVATLKTENSRLLAERQALKAEADRLRGTDLAEVLQRMYGAHEAADSHPNYRTRKFEIDGRAGNIAITGELWTDNATGKGGKGAINLVMHLESYGQDGFQKAVRLMAEHFSAERIGRDMGRLVALESGSKIAAIQQQHPLPLPAPHPATWPRARAYLVDVRKIPAGLVDKAHERGLIYSDERANLVFKRDGDTGCFKRGSYNPKDRSAFKQTLGRNGKPFKLKGTDGTVYVTEGPIDALALKAMHPSSTVLATGGNCPPEALRPYFGIATQHLYAAHDGDDAGNVQAYRLMAEYIGHFGPQAGARVERHSPGEKKDWSAVLMASPGLSKWGIKAEPAPVTPMPDIIQTLRAETARRQAQAVQPKLSQEVETPPALPAASVPPQPTPSRPITPSFRPPKGPGMGP